MNCAWCSKPAVGEVELEKARKGKDKRTGLMVVKKPPKTAPVCKDHRDIVDRQTPFYTCGCFYVEGEMKCPRHQNTLRSPWKEKLSNHTIKHSPVEKDVTIASGWK